jgi:membrane protein DedA with SNARE-associated domain
VLSFVGSFIWCGALALGGWYFGDHWEELRAIMRPFDIPIAIVILAGLAYYVYRHVTHGTRKHKPSETVKQEETA